MVERTLLFIAQSQGCLNPRRGVRLWLTLIRTYILECLTFLLIKDQQKIVKTFEKKQKKHNLPQVQDQQQDLGTGPHATTDLVSGFALS